ncbi:MAG: hypothetical protein HYV09_36205 [Deltaproteobacteria bacterium]|nr:hypothetical protein [Deltaproteobacteria bacterium]
MSDARRPRVLALDLESTLISNAVSQFARPGLASFLTWALAAFERVVLFTSVPEERATAILQLLISEGEAPPEAARIAYVQWSGRQKDLGFVRAAEVDEILLVDDQERYIVPEQRSQWVAIAEWDVPYAATDRELDRVRAVLEERLSGT